MATLIKAWDIGSGNITLTYDGQGDGTISVQSDANNGNARSQVITIKTLDETVTRSITINQAAKVISDGVYIEDTDGNLYEDSDWSSSKTANAIVIIDGSWKRRIYIDSSYSAAKLLNSKRDTALAACTSTSNGAANISVLASHSSYSRRNFTIGGQSYLPAYSELLTILEKRSQINSCRSALGKSTLPSGVIWWSSTYHSDNGTYTYMKTSNGSGGRNSNVYYILNVAHYS